MKVDPNQLIGATLDHGARTGGIPLRLHIATQLLAGLYSDDEWSPRGNPYLSVLQDADKLIAAHNETCEVSHE